MSHAYYVTGNQEAGIDRARAFIEQELKLKTTGNPDVSVFTYGLLSVDDARALADTARQAPVAGNARPIVIAAGRLFHEAQNALLKVFEEPPEHTYLFLVVPAEGVLLPTLRSRMTPLGEAMRTGGIAEEFLKAAPAAREKLVEKLVERAKSEKDEEKQAARADAIALGEGITAAAYAASQKNADPQLTQFLKEMDAFLPMLHDRAAPLKLIFAHVLLTLPRSLVR